MIELSEAFFDRWFWIIIGSLTLIMVVPLIVVWAIVESPPEVRLIATILIIVVWGVVAGYKDWIVSRRQGKEKPKFKYPDS